MLHKKMAVSEVGTFGGNTDNVYGAATNGLWHLSDAGDQTSSYK